MKALTRFAANGHVEMLIPWIVAREFTSKPSPRIETMAELRKSLKNLKKTGLNELHKKIADFETSVEKEFERHESLAKQRFAEWEKRTGAVILPPAADHATKVMDKYFAGTLPFSSEKARTDIPDAFVVEAILDLTSQGPIFALAHDGLVAEALKANPGIKVFKTVKALLDSDDFQDALGDIDEIDAKHEQANVEKVVVEFLRDNTRFRSPMEDDISRLVAGKTLQYRNPNHDEKEGPDEIFIDSVQEVSEWTFDGTSDYLGEGVVLVNFEASVEIDADDPMGGSWHDEEGNLDSSRIVTVLGAVSISLDVDDISRDPAKTTGVALLNSATVSVDQLDDISLVPRSY
jgi:hypothetical protein